MATQNNNGNVIASEERTKQSAALVPKLRFKEFEGAWEETKIGDNIIILSGFPFKSDLFVDEGHKLVIPKNFTKFGYGNFSNTYSKYTSEKVDSKYICKENDLLVLLTDLTQSCELLGKPLVLKESDGNVLLNQRVIKIDCNEKLRSDFLSNFFLTERYHKIIKVTSSGSTVRHSSNKIINNIKINLPNLPEQQKIANFLTAVDTKLQQLTTKKELLAQYKKGVMQQLFSQQLRFKPDASQLSLRGTKQSVTNENQFPDWEEKRLGEVSEPIKRTTDEIVGNIMTISGKNGFMSQKDRFSQVIAAGSLSKYTYLYKDEFAYNRGNSKSFKYGCVYRLNKKEALVPYVYHCFKLNNGVPEFFEQIFKAKFLDKQLRRLISSSARMDGLLNIGAKSFFSVKVIFPKIEEQEKIATYLRAIDAKIELVNVQLTKTQAFKNGLLQAMFV
jgi:type I restriction enzyme S subunit